MSQAADYLLIDISNSFTKLAFASKTRVVRPRRMATDKLMSACLRQFVKRRKIEMVVVCSVVPRKNRVVRTAALNTKALWLSSRFDLGFGIDYPHPRSIGAVPLANATAVARFYGSRLLL